MQLSSLRVVHTRALRIWMENFFFDFNFFLSKISRFDRGSNLRSLDFESFSTRMLKPLSYRANQNNSKTNRFYTKQICVGFSFCSYFDIMHSKNWIEFIFREIIMIYFLWIFEGPAAESSFGFFFGILGRWAAVSNAIELSMCTLVAGWFKTPQPSPSA